QYLVDKSGVSRSVTHPDTLLFKLDSTGSPPAQLDALGQQLVNLPPFSRATWALDTTGGDTAVVWTLTEGRTVFPLLNFGGVRGNTFYQIGVNDLHFRGRGQQLTAFYQNNDGQHNYYLAFRNPHLRGSRWGYALETRRYAAIEPLYFPQAVNYRYANLSTGGEGTYALDPNQHLSFGGSIFRETYQKLASEPETTPGPDNASLLKLLLKAGYRRDRINYHYERQAGTHHQTTAEYVRSFADRANFFIAWHDFRYYRLLGQRGNLAARLRTGISSNQDSPFAPFVLDSQVNIRGSGNRIDRGTAQLILNLEYRGTVWRDRRERFAVQLVGFSDLGTWRNPGGELADLWDEANLRHFVGGGLRLIYLRAFNAALRIDYGVEVRDTRARGVVVGFGQYF
ncbi:MAG: BamA/TamA family outer membrane protein, partial [Bacteroidota bacterium]